MLIRKGSCFTLKHKNKLDERWRVLKIMRSPTKKIIIYRFCNQWSQQFTLSRPAILDGIKTKRLQRAYGKT